MVFQKFKLEPTIVGAAVIEQPINMGSLGSLVSGDVLIVLASGDLTTMENGLFFSKFSVTSQSADLTGTI